MHEYRRPRGDPDIMSDIYDAPRWREKIGAPTNVLRRIALQYCVDGIPAFNRKSCLSVKPAQFIVLSLPPWLRYQARHMLIQMLVPSQLKGQAAKKYYDFVAHYEMNELHLVGVSGVKVLMYGDTLDAPGRRELLAMESVQAFYPCPHCLHTCQPGVRRQQCGGFRRCLPKNSPWRQKTFTYRGCHYMFRDVETRDPPIARTDANVSVMISLARPRRPFCGHKGFRFLHEWCGVDWAGSACDVMHDKKAFTDMLLKGLVGNGSGKGMYAGWKNNDSAHRRDCEIYKIFPEFYESPNALPPWRLSKVQRKIADMRVRSVWWPHYRDKLCSSRGESFFEASDTMWKCSHKHYILMVLLPTCLHGFVKAVHNAILMTVYALRKLAGQTISVAEAVARNVLPGEVVIKKSSIPAFGRELTAGLSMVEGSFPVDHINPNSHHVGHFSPQTGELGILDWLAMFSFERNNKRVKEFVRNPGQPLSSLAKNLAMDIATRLSSYLDKFETSAPPTLVLSVPSRFHGLSKRERIDLGILGVTSTRGVKAFDVARIVTVHFRSGEWGRRECGSVITFIHAGISRYCVVEKFLQVQGKSFARVTWLSKPHYLYAPNKLVVQVYILPHAQQCTHSCVIPLDRIEPTSVAVIPDPDGVHFFMMREKGYDRTSA